MIENFVSGLRGYVAAIEAKSDVDQISVGIPSLGFNGQCAGC